MTKVCACSVPPLHSGNVIYCLLCKQTTKVKDKTVPQLGVVCQDDKGAKEGKSSELVRGYR